MRHFVRIFVRSLSASLWSIKRTFQSKNKPPKTGEGIWSRKDFK